MTRELSLQPRLALLASLVPQGAVLADVGTDHGYIPVCLRQRGVIDRAIASDIGREPLEHARRTAEEYGVGGIDLRLCAGLDAIAPEECDTVLIAGMGGETIWGILAAAPWTRDGRHTLLLQPQTKIEELRLRLCENGYAVTREHLVRDKGKLYVVMTVTAGERYTPGAEQLYGGLALEREALYGDYLAHQIARLRRRAEGLRQHLLAGGSLEMAEEDFICTAAQQPDTGLYLVLQRPQVFNRNTLDLLYTVSLGCAALGVLICVGLSWKLSRQMFRPIQHLHSAIQAVGQNDLNVRVQLDQDDELGELAKRFDGMVAALKHNQEQLVENQRELNQAQIRMLQAQLNPHFLCNTLDTMKWISKINQVPQVAVMSTDLADILRFCISPEEFVPLRREAEILQRYMEIQRIRMSGAISFRLDLPEELADCLTPKMILQPLVENAVLHGVDGTEHGEIWVRARERDGNLNIQVLDNGRGLPDELLGPYARRDRELSRGHLGLYNVDTILIKYYGEGFGLYLENRTDGPGAVVTATLPIRREEKAQC